MDSSAVVTENTVELEPLQISDGKEDTQPQPDYSSAPLFTNEYQHVSVENKSPLGNPQLAEFFPPSDLPRGVQLLRLENIAIPGCYLVVGTLQGLARPLLNVWPLDLGATEAQQTTMMAISTLPATFKIVFGFWSDNVPIFGYRRKPYMLGGWVLCSVMMALLIWSSALTLSFDEQDGTPKAADSNAPSVQWLSACFFTFGCGLWLADCIADSVVAEKTHLEPRWAQGRLQSTCYASRFFGMMVAAPLSTALYTSHGPATIVSLLMMVPVFLLPLIVCLQEDHEKDPPPVQAQCAEIWRTVCRRSVWQPLAFCYIFNLLQVSNAAWRQFLSTNLQFSEADLNALLVVSYTFLFVGTITYKYCFIHVSWRRLYQVCMLLNCAVSSLQLLLISGHTAGLPPFWFALGDDAVIEFIGGIQFLPNTILMVSLCPPGSEGASYAMLTTFWNSAQMLSPAISSRLLSIWNVSKEALVAGELDGLYNLTVLTTLIQLSPVALIGLLPHGRDDLMALSEKPYSGSPIGGAIFLSVLIISMTYTFSVAMWNILWGGSS